MTIDILPDDALLEVFSFYLVEAPKHKEPWRTLVHVCRRWRSIIFASPRRLDVQIFYTPERQVNVMLDIWPNLPIHISRMPEDGYKRSRWRHEHRLIAALEHTNRICQIQLKGFSGSELENILPAMQKSFPALTSLDIECVNYTFPLVMAVLPQTFLGGYIEHLRSFNLLGVEFPSPGMWKLFLTANHLVTLRLWDSPRSMYAQPEEIVTYLSTMPNLESFSFGFRSPLLNWPDEPNQLLSPLTRVVLPTLTKLHFLSMSEYIEDFVSRIDVPLLDKANVTFFDRLVFDNPRLHDFLIRNEKIKAHSRGGVAFWYTHIEFKLDFGSLVLEILCGRLGRQISSMAQLCRSSLHLPSALERLDIREGFERALGWHDQTEDVQWLDLLHPFTGLKDLHLDKGVVPYYALALRELAGERVTEVLPALNNLFIEGLEQSGPIREALGQFAAARQLSGFPVMVQNWDGRS